MIEKKTRQMPKGGRKGGAVFPRVALSDALLFARKLVSKTHTSAQPQDVILTGVMGSKGGTGRVSGAPGKGASDCSAEHDGHRGLGL